MKQVYLDYAATTPVKEEVVREMLPYYTEVYFYYFCSPAANPSRRIFL